MSNSIRIKFGQNVRRIRSLKQVSQEELAFSCGLHRTYISDIERGVRNISIDNIEKIALALGVKPMYLLDFDTTENS